MARVGLGDTLLILSQNEILDVLFLNKLTFVHVTRQGIFEFEFSLNSNPNCSVFSQDKSSLGLFASCACLYVVLRAVAPGS